MTRHLTEMQAFLLLLMRNGPGGTLYVAGHIHLPDTVELSRGVELLRDPRKSEDLRSLLRKLERLRAAGLCVVSRETFFMITDSGREALEGRARVAIDNMRTRFVERQNLWDSARD